MHNTTASLLREAVKLLEDYESAPLEAAVLLAATLGRPREYLLAHPDHSVSKKHTRRFFRLVARRKRGIPAAYLLRSREFWSRDFLIRAPVFIPRPDTETLIETILDCAPSEDFTLHDLCTGSGCIAITAAMECPQATVSASDISLAALRIARRNNRCFGNPVRRITRSNFLSRVRGPFRMISANPPYLSHAEWRTLAHRGESRRALYCEENGLAAYRHITEEAQPRLEEGGFLIYEVGWTQADAVAGIMRAAGFVDIELRKDLAGRQRVVKGTCSR